MSLYDKAKKVTAEMTTSGDIAYAPGALKPADDAAKSLLKDKSTKMNKDMEKKIFGKTREETLREQHDSKLPKLKVQLMRELDGIIGNSKLNVDEFHSVFVGNGIRDMGVAKTAIKYQTIPDDLVKLEQSLPDEVGDLELILSALKAKRSIAGYDPFSDYDHLFGARMATAIQGINVMYEGRLSTSYAPLETLYISDFDKAEEIAEEIDGIKRVNKILVPVGGVFNKGFFSKVKNILTTEKEKPVKGEKK